MSRRFWDFFGNSERNKLCPHRRLLVLEQLESRLTPACDATFTNHVLTIDNCVAEPGQPNVIVLSKAGAEPEAEFLLNGASITGGPDPFDTSAIHIIGQANNANHVTLDYIEQGYRPGFESEPNFTSEIEISITGGSGLDVVTLDASRFIPDFEFGERGIHWDLGANGVNFNEDDDVDLTLTAVDQVRIIGTDTADRFNAAGSAVVGVVFPLPVSIAGGSGFGETFCDSLIGGSASDTLDGGDGCDELTGSGGNDLLPGGPGNDLLLGGDGSDTLLGDDGDDSLDGGDGVDSLVGSAGNDTLFGGNDGGPGGADVLDGGADNDTLNAGGGPDTLLGGPGADTLNGSSGNDTLDGGPDADTLIGGRGNDTSNGGDGIDQLLESFDVNLVLTDSSLSGDLGSDTLLNIETAKLTGGASFNTLDASAFTLGPVTLDGGLGGDNLKGGSGHDSLSGNAGNDFISGGLGDDTINGGADSDRVIETGSNLTAANTSLTGVGTDVLIAMNSAFLTGTSGNDTINAAAFGGPTTINGGAGDDIIRGGSSSDKIFGDAGNDLISGSAGNDSLDGGAGIDRFFESKDVSMVLGNASFTGVGLGTDVLSSFETAVLTSGISSNTLDASGFTNGPVTLIGGGGGDFLKGGSGNDSLVGGDANDRLEGNAGNDSLNGGAGTDTGIGGAGTDVFVSVETQTQ